MRVQVFVESALENMIFENKNGEILHFKRPLHNLR